jgi:hypothetical protein
MVQNYIGIFDIPKNTDELLKAAQIKFQEIISFRA